MYAHKKDRHVPPNNIKCNLCGYETTFTVNMEEHNDGTENSKSWATIPNLVLSQNLWKMRLRSKKQKQYHYYCIVCTPNLPKASFLFIYYGPRCWSTPTRWQSTWRSWTWHPTTSTLSTQFLSKLKQESALSSHFRYLLVLCPAWDMIIFHKQAWAELGQAQYKICQLGKLKSSASCTASIEVYFHQDNLP